MKVRDGTGTITHGPSQPMANRYGGAAWPGSGSYATPCLEMIPNAKEVYNRLRQAQVQSLAVHTVVEVPIGEDVVSRQTS